MHLGNIIITRDSEISSLDERSEDVLTLDLSHLLFVLDTKVLTNELGIESNDLYDLVPQLKELATYLVEVLHELERNLVGITKVNSLRERNERSAPSSSCKLADALSRHLF